MRDPVGEALVALVHPQLDPRPRVEALILGGRGAELVTAARRHRMGAFLRPVLEEIPATPAELLAAVWAAELHASHTHNQAVDELARVTRILDGTPLLAFKGPVAAALLYERPALRPYQDLDLLVPRTSFADAVRRLEEAGYEVIDRNWTMLRREMAGQLHVRREAGMGSDLHWDLLYAQRVRACFEIDVAPLFTTARHVQLGSTCAATFDAAATLVHLCLHACREGGGRLLWLIDIRNAAAVITDWDGVVELALRWRVHLLVGTMLARAATTIGLPVPTDVVATLVPSRSHRWLLRTLDRRFPLTRSSERGSPATLLARATRATFRSTLAEALRGASSRTTATVRTRSLARPDRRQDPAHSGSALHPQGTAADRDAYFTRVTVGTRDRT